MINILQITKNPPLWERSKLWKLKSLVEVIWKTKFDLWSIMYFRGPLFELDLRFSPHSLLSNWRRFILVDKQLFRFSIKIWN